MSSHPKRSRARSLTPLTVDSLTPIHLTEGRVRTVVYGNTVTWVYCVPSSQYVQHGRWQLTQGFSTHPYHHEGAWAQGRYLNSPWARQTRFGDALDLIRLVTEQAYVGAKQSLDELQNPNPALRVIAIRCFAGFSTSVEDRLGSVRLQTQADNVMYREALTQAASDLGLGIRFYQPLSVLSLIIPTLQQFWQKSDIKRVLRAAGASSAADQKLAMAAALAV